MRLGDAAKRRDRNCDCDSNPGFYLEWAPEERRCPNSVITAEAWGAVQWWLDWRDFEALPYAGGMSDQPAYVYEAIQICNSEQRCLQQEADKAARLKWEERERERGK